MFFMLSLCEYCEDYLLTWTTSAYFFFLIDQAAALKGDQVAFAPS